MNQDDGISESLRTRIAHSLRSDHSPFLQGQRFFKFNVPSFRVEPPESFSKPFDELRERLQPFFKRLRAKLPNNWPEHMYQLDEARAIIEDEGIPLVYVPRAEIVEALVAAASYEERRSILQAQSREIASDCLYALKSGVDLEYKEQIPLAIDAADALIEGRYRAAQALAVATSDTLIRSVIHEKYPSAKKISKMKDLDDSFRAGLLRVDLSVAELGCFLTEWHPDSGLPMPVALSRHVSIHHASVHHYNEANAVVAVMICTSLLRGFTELKGLSESEAGE